MKDVLYHLITIDMLFKGGINMYKKVGIILISAILILGGIGSYARERVVLENTKTNYKTIGSSLAMMYEIKAESGEYQAVNDSVWPQDGINNGVKGQTAAGVYDCEIRNATTLYNARMGERYIPDMALDVPQVYGNYQSRIKKKKKDEEKGGAGYSPLFLFFGEIPPGAGPGRRRPVCEIDYDWGEVTISPLRTCSMSCLAVSTVVISGTMTSRCQSG